MRPIIVLAFIVAFILLCVFAFNITAPSHDNLAGTYSYGGKDLIVQSNTHATYGDTQVSISEVRETNLFDLYSSDETFPSGRYTYSNGNLIGLNSGVTFLKG